MKGREERTKLVKNEHGENGSRGDSLNQDEHSIEIKICLQGHMREDEGTKQIKVEAHLPGWIAQELEVQAGGTKLGRCHNGVVQAGPEPGTPGASGFGNLATL